MTSFVCGTHTCAHMHLSTHTHMRKYMKARVDIVFYNSFLPYYLCVCSLCLRPWTYIQRPEKDFKWPKGQSLPYSIKTEFPDNWSTWFQPHWLASKFLGSACLCPSFTETHSYHACLYVCWRFEVSPHALGCWAIPLVLYPTLSCWPCDERASLPPLSGFSEGMTSILRDLALLWDGSSVDKISFSWLWIYISLSLQQQAAARKELVNRFAFESRKERTHATYSHLARASQILTAASLGQYWIWRTFLTYSSSHSQYYNILYSHAWLPTQESCFCLPPLNLISGGSPLLKAAVGLRESRFLPAHPPTNCFTSL